MRVRDGGEVKVFDGVSGEFWCELEEGGMGVITEKRRDVGAGQFRSAALVDRGRCTH
jgi:hypothetical protein